VFHIDHKEVRLVNLCDNPYRPGEDFGCVHHYAMVWREPPTYEISRSTVRFADPRPAGEL
jgi:hypothetical protein